MPVLINCGVCITGRKHIKFCFMQLCNGHQWHSQALKSESAQGSGGRNCPQRGPGAEPRWSLGANPPEARYIRTVCSCQMLFCAGLLLSPSSIFSLPPKKTSDLHESYDPTWPEQGGHMHVPTRGYTTSDGHCRV